MTRNTTVRVIFTLAILLGGVSAVSPPTAEGRTVARRLVLATEQPSQLGAVQSAHVPDRAVRDKQGNVRVVVKLDTPSVASYRGGISGLGRPRRTTAGALDLTAATTREYRQFVNRRIDGFTNRVASYAPHAKVTQRYDVVFGGVAMTVPVKDLAGLEAQPDVAAVLPDTLEQLQTDTTPAFLGAPAFWSKLGGQASAGERVIVGVLDTGIWPEHPSLSDPDPSGKAYPTPLPPTSGARACQFTGGANPGPAFACNDKLIGAQRFMATYEATIGLLPGEFTSARDDNGHGTHTATTAAGNARVNASIFGTARGVLSGIAPRAQVIAYKVCGDAGCFASDSVAAIQEAVNDRVDVINFSIGGGSDPYNDAVSLAFLDAYNAEVFVAASAGNSGPTPDTVEHREPWVTTVAASTENRTFQGSTLLASSDGSSLRINGTTVSRSLTTASPLVDAGAAPTNDPFCASTAVDGAYASRVVICRVGGVGRTVKGYNVLRRGAVGMILIDGVPGNPLTDSHFLPAIHLQQTQGNRVTTYLGAHPNVTAKITTGTATAAPGDVMAAFSSRGGPNQTLAISKPDVTAPGVQVLAGDTPAGATPSSGPSGELFQAIAGTSMSSPHVAGAAALIAALKPGWNPGQIRSALMTTAQTAVKKENGTTATDAFDDGSGRINLRASTPYFLYNADGASFVANRETLYKVNYPSLYVPRLAGSLKVTRTLKSVDTVSRSYTVSVTQPSDLKVTVSPAAFTLAAGASAVVSITVDGKDVPLGQTRFATVLFKTGSGASARSFVFPVTIVRRQGSFEITKNCAPDPIAVGAQTTCTIRMTNPSLSASNVALTDATPARARLVPGSTVGGTESGSTVKFNGAVPGRTPIGVSIASGSSPAGGYLPLSAFGIPPLAGITDDTIVGFNVPAYVLGGRTYTEIGFASNGYAVLGPTSSADNSLNNQSFPNVNRPNNVLSPFWTDLNPAAGGAMRIGTLTDGTTTWLVLDWEAVKEFSTTRVDSFQIWIGVSGAEDVSYAYGALGGNGDGGFLSVGVENPEGNRGQNWYYNGTGSLPVDGTQLRVTATPEVMGQKVVSFRARGNSVGNYVNYANVTGSTFPGTAIARFQGRVN